MYTGSRDPEIQIIVPQRKCFEYISKKAEHLVEIEIPPEHPAQYNTQWGSIIVRPDQVYDIGYGLNLVCVNDGADIQNSWKNIHHIPTQSETLKPQELIGRYLKYYRYVIYHQAFPNHDVRKAQLEDIPSIRLYQDMAHMCQSMRAYMNRLPMYL